MEEQVIENAVQETVQDTVEKVNSNMDQLKTYFNSHIPDLISFGMKVVLAILAFSVVTESVKPPIEIPRLPDILIMAANSLFSNRLRDNNSSLTRTVKLIFSPARSASTLRPLFHHHEKLLH